MTVSPTWLLQPDAADQRVDAGAGVLVDRVDKVVRAERGRELVERRGVPAVVVHKNLGPAPRGGSRRP